MKNGKSKAETAASPRPHAILSASSSKQWLNCPPSARLQEQFPNESTAYAEEGTAAHKLAEYKVRHGYLHERMKRPQSDYYTDEIDQATDVYADFIAGIIEDMKRNGVNPLVLVEERLDFSDVVPEGFGTGDMVVIGKTDDGKGLIHIVEYKNGTGVFVSAVHNSQMMLYALGALHGYDYIYDVEVVRMSIVQPRMDNISTFECTKTELLEWAESIKPIARLAYEGRGEQRPGDWCQFCRAKPLCRARMEEALALAREEFLDLDAGKGALAGEAEATDATAPYTPDNSAPTFKAPGLIPLAELENVLPTLNRISSWIEAVFAYVSSEAINHGVPIRGYKVVRGRSNREFTDIEAVIKAAQDAGYNDLYKHELITLTEFEKMMGKKKFAEILGEYVTKPLGKLSLVPESDKRPAVDVSNENRGVSDDFDALD